MRLGLFALISGALALAGCGNQAKPEHRPIVLAAASLQESLTQAAAEWAASGHAKPILSFAASSALARQIESGAAAALFISADEDWMNDVQSKGLLKPGSRHLLVRNALVLIAPASGPSSVALTRLSLSRALGIGRIAMADPASVPAGRYGKAALQNLGLWPLVRDKIANSENVRAGLTFVERSEVPLGIVYLTDAKASKKVRIVATFPDNSHPPILYPVAVLSSGDGDALAFEQFLLSPRGQAIFQDYGFGAGSSNAQR